MSRRFEHTTAMLKPEQLEGLRKASVRTRLSQAELIRQGVDLILEKEARGELGLGLPKAVGT